MCRLFTCDDHLSGWKEGSIARIETPAADFYCSEGSSFRTFQGLVGCNLYLLSARCLFDKG